MAREREKIQEQKIDLQTKVEELEIEKEQGEQDIIEFQIEQEKKVVEESKRKHEEILQQKKEVIEQERH